MRPDRSKAVSKVGGSDPVAALVPTDATFRALIENSTDAIALFDSERKFIYASAATERLLGFTPVEMLGTDPFELTHPEDLAQVKVRLKECMASPGKPMQIIARVRHKDGSWRTLEGLFTNLLHDPQVRGIVSNYRDITKRLEAETALRESEEKFKRAFRSSPNSMSITTLQEGVFLDVNDAFLRNTGYAREDVIGHSSIYTAWVDKEERNRMLRLLREQGRVDGMETAFLTKSGKTVLSSLSAVIVEIGGVECVLTTSQDITERKRTAERLRRSEEKYRSLIELAPHGIYRASADGRMLMVNSAFVKMLGYETADEVLRLDVATDIFQDPRERDRIVQRAESQPGPVPPFETTWKRKDGSVIRVRAAARCIYDRKGKLTQTEVFVENVTGQRALEKQLQMAQKMEAIGLLAGGVAHDFNNLLMIIRSRAELLVADASKPEEVVQQADEIIRAARRASALTRQLLTFSRHQVLEPTVLNLNTLLADLSHMLPHLIGKHIETRIITAADLGCVRVDRGQFEQVVMNLAINARDAMPNGGCLMIETTNIELDRAQPARYPLMKAGRYVSLSVTDSGTGMDAETQAHIFEPFFTTKEHGKGTGLGLAMVYGTVQQSGGYISVDSAPETGTRFTIYLPEVTEPEEICREEKLLPVPGGTETILFVEDEEAVCKVGADFLRSKGYDVLTAEDGIEALRICRTLGRPIHLLVTDLIMPRMGGAELAKRALDLNRDLRTIYVSGYSGRILSNSAPISGQPILQKPFSMADLARQVRAALDGASVLQRRQAS